MELVAVFAHVLQLVIVLILILLHLLLPVPHLAQRLIRRIVTTIVQNINEVIILLPHPPLIAIPKYLPIQKIRTTNEVVALILNPTRPLRLNKISLALDHNLSKKSHVLGAVNGAISLTGLVAIQFATERNIVVKSVCARVTMQVSVPITMMIVNVVVFHKMKLNPVIFLEMTTPYVANGPSSIFGPFAFQTIIAVGMEPNGENKLVSVALKLLIPSLVLQHPRKHPA
jgi:hypothetical protein